MQSGPGVSLYLTLLGVVLSFLSTFWAFGYTRLSRKLLGYSRAAPQGKFQRISKQDVRATLERGCWFNVLGMASTLLGLQATVGLLVAKTLTNATANPFLAGGAGSYNPVLALDVFLVQVNDTSKTEAAGIHLLPKMITSLKCRPRPTPCCPTLCRCFAPCG